MDWPDLPEAIDALTDACAEPAWAVRKQAADAYTTSSIGYYYNPGLDQVALYSPLALPADLALCKTAAERGVGADHVRAGLLSSEEATSGDWIKVAYSAGLRRLGELLNFFPGKYPGGIPNAASPAAAMLTSGTVGAGLGYATGALGERFLPDSFEKGKPRRTGAILGAMPGLALGGAWLGGNLANHHGAFDPWPNQAPGTLPQLAADFGKQSADELIRAGTGTMPAPAGRNFQHALELVKQAWGETFGAEPEFRQPTSLDVNVNALGQTLWESGASPALAGSTMGAMYAAQQMPDPRSRPNWVTGNQLGQLAMNAGKDYLTGVAVGAGLNATIGTPWRPSSVGLGAMALGAIGSLIPKLFG